MKRLLIPLLLALAVPSCQSLNALPKVDTHQVMVDVDKAILVADAGYHGATAAAAKLVAARRPDGTPVLSPKALDALETANDATASALHTAKKVRTSAAVNAALGWLATFQKLAGVK